MRYYLFPKFFRQFRVEELMEHCVRAGLDGPAVLVRDGYWISPDALGKDLPAFIRAAEGAGLSTPFAFTDFPPRELVQDDASLRTIADNGIPVVRVGIIGRNEVSHVRELHDHSRRLTEQLAAIAAKLSIKVVIQLHGAVGPHVATRGCHPHNATAAWHLVKDLDPGHVGIMIDPGNNIHQEGYEAFGYQIPLLGDHIAAVGVKDACALRSGEETSPSKGWETYFVPCYEGQVNWHTVYRELAATGFDGPMVVMPFYDADNLEWLFSKFLSEMEYLRGIERATRLSGEDE
jgi:sugar phosphate isomerase/epimerase